MIELGADVRAEEAKATLRGRHAAGRAAAGAAALAAAAGPDRAELAARDVIEVGDRRAAGPRDVAVGATRASCPSAVGVLPLRDTVTFPDMLIPLNVGQERSIELINDVLRGDRTIAMVASRNPEVETPGARRALHVGVLGVVARMIRVPDGTLRVLIQGGQRVRIERWVRTEPYLVAEIAEAARRRQARRPS